MKHAKLLNELGFSDNEATVYDTLLHSGKLGIAQITKQSGVKRSTVYLALSALGKRGLVRQTVIGKRSFYLPESPQRLLRLAEQQQKAIQGSLPDMLAVFAKATHEPKVISYYGKESIQQLFVKVQDEALWTKSIFSPASFYRVFSRKESRAFAANFEDRGAKLKSLIPDTPEGRKIVLANQSEGYGGGFKFLPKDYELSVNTLIWGDNVALISYENLFGVHIENSEISQFFENQFDWWWKTLK